MLRMAWAPLGHDPGHARIAGRHSRAILLRGNSLPIIRRYDGRTEPRAFASVRGMSDTEFTRGPSVRGIPEGDNRERMICAECGYILYDNPKIVVGSVPRWGDRLLLCRRAIHPRKGFWTLPAGYLELNESTGAGAEREAWEEAFARIRIEGLLAIYDIPRISQVQLIYRALLLDERSRPARKASKSGCSDGTTSLGTNWPSRRCVGP